jgi:hypothetical protein
MMSEDLCDVWEVVSAEDNAFAFISGILGVYPHCKADTGGCWCLEMVRRSTAQSSLIADRPERLQRHWLISDIGGHIM